MTATETFQITPEQAELYEERFVPALFAHWVDAVLDAAGVRTGQTLLDVACGTGIVARYAAERVGPTGHVTGLDLNPAMLAVASRVSPHLIWQQGDVSALPFDDDTFDVVTSPSAAMFFPDLTGALREMGRVTRPGGTVGGRRSTSARTSRHTDRGSRWWPDTPGTTRCGCSGRTGCTETATACASGVRPPGSA